MARPGRLQGRASGGRGRGAGGTSRQSWTARRERGMQGMAMACPGEGVPGGQGRRLRSDSWLLLCTGQVVGRTLGMIAMHGLSFQVLHKYPALVMIRPAGRDCCASSRKGIFHDVWCAGMRSSEEWPNQHQCCTAQAMLSKMHCFILILQPVRGALTGWPFT